ncbi:MAG TPA: hypothetical protein DCE41_37945 [Cytophagales bacterium]|nr:hypothetical protein [Cytophagales bacterium]HAA19060.1 hypothetical protein [Cytophagales bacterium]HAP60167.1 hypothetical protein [Cytophagales bacterium]
MKKRYILTGLWMLFALVASASAAHPSSLGRNPGNISPSSTLRKLDAAESFASPQGQLVLLETNTQRASLFDAINSLSATFTNTGDAAFDSLLIALSVDGAWLGSLLLAKLDTLDTAQVTFTGYQFDQPGTVEFDLFAWENGDSVAVFTTKEIITTSESLPLFEDFSGIEDVDLGDGDIIPGHPAWVYTHELGEGRMLLRKLRFVDDPFGEGHVILDNPNGDATNALTVSVDASGFSVNDSLYFTFSYTVMGDEPDPQDRILVRGSESDPWVELFDWVNNTPNAIRTLSEPLEISKALRGAGQNYSATTQVRIQQNDNFPAATDGIQIDYVRIDTAGGNYSDFAISELRGPVDGFFLGANESITASVLNLTDSVNDDASLRVTVQNPFGNIALDTTVLLPGPWAFEETQSVLLSSLDFTEKGKYVVTADLFSVNDLEARNNSRTETVLSQRIVNSYPFSASLATQPEGLYDPSNEGWEWVQPDTTQSSDFAWVFDAAGQGLSPRESFLYLPGFNFTSLDEAPVILFTLDYNLSGNDQLSLEVSADLGSTWSWVPPSTVQNSGWYTQDTPYWSGTSDGPAIVYNRLNSSTDGGSYLYRLRLVTDGTQAGEGVALSSFRIFESDSLNASDDVSFLAFNTNRLATSQPIETVDLLVSNNGQADLDSVRLDLYLQGGLIATEQLVGFTSQSSQPITFSGFLYDIVGYTAVEIVATDGLGDTLAIFTGEELLSGNVSIPLHEDFTGIADVTLRSDSLVPGLPGWTYANDSENARLWTFQPKTYGTGPDWEGFLVMDNPGGESFNFLTIALDADGLSVNDSVFLSFFWGDLGDEMDAGDIVEVRGSAIDDWVELYNWGANGLNGQTNYSGKLNIAEALRNAGQSFSATTEVRFGQNDNFPANTDGFQLELVRIDTQSTSQDVSVVGIREPANGYFLGANEQVITSFVNLGDVYTEDVVYRTTVVSPSGVTQIDVIDTLIGPLAEGESRFGTLEVDFTEKGKYLISSTLLNINDDVTENNAASEQVYSYRLVDTIPFVTNFFLQPEGFIDPANDGWAWISEDSANVLGTSSGWLSDVQGLGKSARESLLYFPTFDFSNEVNDPGLTLFMDYTLGAGDQLTLEMSQDIGASWTVVPPSGTGSSGWYTQNTPYWTGSGSGIFTTVLDSLGGASRVDFRLRLITDGTQAGEGVALQGVRIESIPVVVPDPRTDLVWQWDNCFVSGEESVNGAASAVLVNDPVREAGYVQQGITFANPASYIEITTTENGVYTDSMTVALWLNPATVSQKRWVVGRNKLGQTASWLLRLRDGVPELALPGVSGPGIYGAGTSLTPNTWQHVAFTFSGGTVIAYINGVETARYSGIGGQINPNGEVPITVGRSVDGLSNNIAFLGSVDELWLSSGALDSAEIATLANEAQNSVACGVDAGSLKAAWNFDDCNEDFLANSVTAAEEGMRFNGAVTDTGYNQQALYLDGVNDYARLYDTTWSTGANDALTYSVWVYPTNPNGNYEAILSRVTTGNSVLIALKNLRPAVLLGGLSPNLWNEASTPLPLNQWSHLTVSYGNGTLTMYVNGAEVLKQSNLTGALNFGSGFHQVGARWDNQRHFSGRIDELRMFNRTFTEEMAAEEYGRLSAQPAGCPLPSLLPLVIHDFEDCGNQNVTDLFNNAIGLRFGATIGTGYVQQGVVFDGNDYITFANNSNLKFSGDFSISLWLNSTQTNGTGVVMINNPDGTNFSYSLNVRNGIPELALGSGISGPSVFPMGISVADGQWHHLVYTFGSGEVTAFLDGAQIRQWTGIQGSVLTNPNTEVWLGGRAGKARYFVGSLDQLRIYDAVISPARVEILADLAFDPADCPASRNQPWEETRFDKVDFSMSPNPTTGQVQLILGQTLNQKAHLTVTNLIGQTVHEAILEAGQATHAFTLEASLESGIYLVHVVTNEGRITRRLVKN